MCTCLHGVDKYVLFSSVDRSKLYVLWNNEGCYYYYGFMLCFVLLSQQLFVLRRHRWHFLKWNTSAITRQVFRYSGICIGNAARLLGLPTLLHCFTAILTPTHQNGGMPQWTLGSPILPPIGTAAPQIPLSSKLKQAHQRACKEAAWSCDRERGNENEWGENKEIKKKPHLRNPQTWQSLIQINICEW